MTAQAPAVAEAIERYARLLWRDGDVREVRIIEPGGRIHAGYFDDPAALAAAAAPWDGRANVYVTINPVVPALLSRAHRRIKPRPRETTSDRDVLRRSWLFVDLDAPRPPGIGSTDDELDATREAARAAVRHLDARGWGLPVASMSGNGMQLLYPVALRNDDDATARVAGVLGHLGTMFDSEAVKVDQTVHNAARIAALIGTMKMKGDDTAERPHRRSELLHAPEELAPVPEEMLRALVPATEARSGTIVIASGGTDTTPGWARRRLDAHGIAYRERPPDAKGRTWYDVERCPWHPDDGAWDCGPGEEAGGKALYHGFHDRCTGKGWHDYKTAMGWDTPQKVSAEAPVPLGRNETLPYLTARELGRQTPDRVPWQGYGIAAGALTELDGKPKASGKTTWLCHLIGAKLDGSTFLGWPTTRSAVGMMSEQGRTSLRATLGRAGLLGRDDLYLVLWHDTRALDWPARVAAVVALCAERGAALLVVDTLPQFARLAGDAENDAGAALRAMEPLQAASASGLAVLLSRHDRKGGGDVGESGRGSGAFTGSVDIVLALRRGGDGERPTIRHLHGLSRFDEVPDELVIDLTAEGYSVIGTAADYARIEARAKVIETLPAAGAEGLTMGELVAETEARRSTVQAVIKALHDASEVARTGTGKRGDPYRYTVSVAVPEPAETLAETVSAELFPAPAETPAETEKLSAAPMYVERIGADRKAKPPPAETPAETVGDLTAAAEGIFGPLGATWVNGHDGAPLPDYRPGDDEPEPGYAP